ncbi:MAG: RagB/SusD family nutrient uptake outer membrane protein, partial [Bacteroidota bacterium]
MQSKIFKYLIILLVFAVGTACDNDEFFELDNPPEFPWQSLEEFENAAVGAYYGISGNGGFRTIFAHARLAGELFADGVQIADPSAGFNPQADAEDMYNRVTGEAIPLLENGVWRSAYFGIGFANGAIDFIEDNDGTPFPDAGEDASNRLEGELRFVRAYSYYWLARIYAPAYPDATPVLPFRTSQAANFDEAVQSEIGSANDIYDFIVSDLQQAKTLLPERFDEAVHPAAYADGRVNSFGAAALLAKVLFQMGRYDEALTELNYVIDQNGGDYDLSEEPIEAWNKTGIARGKETIWYYALWAGDGLGGSSNWKHPRRFREYNAFNRDGNGANTNGNRYVAASDHFLQEAGWMDDNLGETAEAQQDLRYTQLYLRFDESNPDPRTQFTPTRPYVWGNKYYRAGRRNTNLPILRLADMHLLRAIIKAELGSARDAAGARADLNAVRNRAGLSDFEGSDAELPAAIHLERFKEMAFEGDRLYYLQGSGQDIPNGDRGAGTVPSKSPFFAEIPDFEVE